MSAASTSALAGAASAPSLGGKTPRPGLRPSESVWRRRDVHVPGDPPRRMTSEAPSFLGRPSLTSLRRSLFAPANLRLPSSDENCYQREASTCFGKPRGSRGPGAPFCFVREVRSTDCWAAAFQHSRMLRTLVIAARWAAAFLLFFSCDSSPGRRFRLHFILSYMASQ